MSVGASFSSKSTCSGFLDPMFCDGCHGVRGWPLFFFFLGVCVRGCGRGSVLCIFLDT